MNAIVELLGPQVQSRLRDTLDRHGFHRFSAALDEETLAALAVVGQHPEGLRTVAVAVMPAGPRSQAYAYRLVVRASRQSGAWVFPTPAGDLRRPRQRSSGAERERPTPSRGRVRRSCGRGER